MRRLPHPGRAGGRTFAKADNWRDRFADLPFEDKGGSHPSRYYQDIAVERALEAIAAGTPRILFLADRNILANQAYNAFSSFPEDALVRIEPDNIRKKGRVPANGSLFDGKVYFTLIDFVKAHHHFSDPEWDGEPLAPEPTEPRPAPPAKPGGFAEKPPADYPARRKIKIQLADGKARHIQHMTCTTFWHPDGTPMSAQQFLELLYGELPNFFKNEAELRALWSLPDTRKKLLQGLAEKGFGPEQLSEMQKIIDAQKSDLFDVLAYIRYATTLLTREERADHAQKLIRIHFGGTGSAERERHKMLRFR